jgi:DNA-binding response OmpR family regulator
MRILMADHDRMLTIMLGRTLEQWGFDVAAARDGAAA